MQAHESLFRNLLVLFISDSNLSFGLKLKKFAKVKALVCLNFYEICSVQAVGKIKMVFGSFFY